MGDSFSLAEHDARASALPRSRQEAAMFFPRGGKFLADLGFGLDSSFRRIKPLGDVRELFLNLSLVFGVHGGLLSG
ncbi:MAG: hypothetical protein WC641_04705 [Patescibacteria group bacterium]